MVSHMPWQRDRQCSRARGSPGWVLQPRASPCAEIYHTTFDWPPEPEIQNRLIEPEGISEIETAKRLLEYHRNIIRILPSYPKILKTISADQPCVDVFYQGKGRLPHIETHKGWGSSDHLTTLLIPLPLRLAAAAAGMCGDPE